MNHAGEVGTSRDAQFLAGRRGKEIVGLGVRLPTLRRAFPEGTAAYECPTADQHDARGQQPERPGSTARTPSCDRRPRHAARGRPLSPVRSLPRRRNGIAEASLPQPHVDGGASVVKRPSTSPFRGGLVESHAHLVHGATVAIVAARKKTHAADLAGVARTCRVEGGPTCRACRAIGAPAGRPTDSCQHASVDDVVVASLSRRTRVAPIGPAGTRRRRDAGAGEARIPTQAHRPAVTPGVARTPWHASPIAHRLLDADLAGWTARCSGTTELPAEGPDTHQACLAVARRRRDHGLQTRTAQRHRPGGDAAIDLGHLADGQAGLSIAAPLLTIGYRAAIPFETAEVTVVRHPAYGSFGTDLLIPTLENVGPESVVVRGRRWPVAVRRLRDGRSRGPHPRRRAAALRRAVGIGWVMLCHACGRRVGCPPHDEDRQHGQRTHEHEPDCVHLPASNGPAGANTPARFWVLLFHPKRGTVNTRTIRAGQTPTIEDGVQRVPARDGATNGRPSGREVTDQVRKLVAPRSRPRRPTSLESATWWGAVTLALVVRRAINARDAEVVSSTNGRSAFVSSEPRPRPQPR